MSDKAAYRKFQQQQKLIRNQQLTVDNFVREAMKLSEGRTFFYYYLTLCGVGRNPFTQNALTTAFNSGELNVGQQLQAHIIEVAPAEFLKMLTEFQEKMNDNGTNTDASDADSTAESDSDAAT